MTKMYFQPQNRAISAILMLIHSFLNPLLVTMAATSTNTPQDNQDSGDGGGSTIADAMDHDDDSVPAAAKQVDLTLLDACIDDDVDDFDFDVANAKPTFEQLLRRNQQTHLQRLTSRKAFQSRLQTFKPLTYFCKPTALSPLVCARFGYVFECVCDQNNNSPRVCSFAISYKETFSRLYHL